MIRVSKHHVFYNIQEVTGNKGIIAFIMNEYNDFTEEIMNKIIEHKEVQKTVDYLNIEIMIAEATRISFHAKKADYNKWIRAKTSAIKRKITSDEDKEKAAMKTLNLFKKNKFVGKKRK